MFKQYYNKELTELKLPIDFNKNLTNVKLPDSLQSITFGNDFNQDLTNVKLPDSLNKIKFSYGYNQQTINTLPVGIKEIKFFSINKPVNNLPITVEKIKIYRIEESNLSLLKIPFGCLVLDFNNEKIDI